LSPTVIPLLTSERVSVAAAVVVALAAVAICSFFTTAAATAGAGATLRSRRCCGGGGSLLFLCRCYSLLPLPCRAVVYACFHCSNTVAIATDAACVGRFLFVPRNALFEMKINLIVSGELLTINLVSNEAVCIDPWAGERTLLSVKSL